MFTWCMLIWKQVTGREDALENIVGCPAIRGWLSFLFEDVFLRVHDDGDHLPRDWDLIESESGTFGVTTMWSPLELVASSHIIELQIFARFHLRWGFEASWVIGDATDDAQKQWVFSWRVSHPFLEELA